MTIRETRRPLIGRETTRIPATFEERLVTLPTGRSAVVTVRQDHDNIEVSEYGPQQGTTIYTKDRLPLVTRRWLGVGPIIIYSWEQ